MTERTLGDILRQSRARTPQQEAERRTRLDAAASAEAAEKLAAVKAFFDAAREYFTEQISAGEKTKGYELRLEKGDHTEAASALSVYQWGNEVRGQVGPRHIATPTNPYHFLWKEFLDWAHSNGLTAAFEYRHDGGGVHSWQELVVNPK